MATCILTHTHSQDIRQLNHIYCSIQICYEMKVVKLYLYPIFFARFAIFEGSTSSKFKYQLPLSTVFVSEKLVDVKLQEIDYSILQYHLLHYTIYLYCLSISYIYSLVLEDTRKQYQQLNFLIVLQKQHLSMSTHYDIQSV